MSFPLQNKKRKQMFTVGGKHASVSVAGGGFGQRPNYSPNLGWRLLPVRLRVPSTKNSMGASPLLTRCFRVGKEDSNEKREKE